MLELLKVFENKRPEIVFEWKDSETEAEGWVVINSLRGGSAGGGTRMRKGLDKQEVLSLAKTMEIKFSVCGPPIGGAKSGINFDPDDPRKEGVLKRWFAAVLPLLKTYYGTGGDLNVDEIREVLPITHAFGLRHCQEGTAVGHFKKDEAGTKKLIERLQVGVSLPVKNAKYTPATDGRFTVADLITGWGVAEAVRHWYALQGKSDAGKKVIAQGFGNVGGPAAWYLAKAGYQVVAIIDQNGGLVNLSGFTEQEIAKFLLSRQSNMLSAPGMIEYNELNEKIWDVKADVFLPNARSRIVSRNHVDRLAAAGVEVISCGANVPFDDNEIFLGPTALHADNKLAVIPDFIANCGMARTFAYLMEGEGPLTEDAIFGDISATIGKALGDILKVEASSPLGLIQKGLDVALNKLNK